MPYRGSPDVSVFMVGGYDLLSSLTDITLSQEAITENTKAPFGTAWDTHAYVGIRQGMISHQGYYDDGVNSAHEALSRGLGVNQVLCYADQGTATGAQFVGMTGAIVSKYTRSPKRGELHKAAGEYKVTGQLDQGRILHYTASATASGAGNAVKATASSTGAVGYLQVTDMATLGHATVKILHSSDNVTYATLFTFTANSSNAVPNAQRLSTTGVVEMYTKSDVTFASASTPGKTITYFAGISRASS